MIKIFSISLFVTLLSVHLISCAQTKQVVKNSYSFYEKHLPGMLRVDEKGEPFPVIPDTAVIVYVETTSKLIKWERAWQNGRSYSIAAQQIVTTPFPAGKLYKDDRQITLFILKGNFLWQLYLSPEAQQKIVPEKKINKNEILLKGKYMEKSFFQKADPPVELKSIPSV